jgi:hypothetical protein
MPDSEISSNSATTTPMRIMYHSQPQLQTRAHGYNERNLKAPLLPSLYLPAPPPTPVAPLLFSATASGLPSPPSPQSSLFGGPSYETQPPMAPIEYITVLSQHDVLSGRGGATNSYRGNRAFRTLVKEYQPQYLQA